MEAVFGLIILFFIYFLPTFVACSRKHKSRGWNLYHKSSIRLVHYRLVNCADLVCF